MNKLILRCFYHLPSSNNLEEVAPVVEQNDVEAQDNVQEFAPVQS